MQAMTDRPKPMGSLNFFEVGGIKIEPWNNASKDVDRMANSIDPDQTTPSLRSSLIWIHTVCQTPSVQKLKDHYSLSVWDFIVN